MCGSEDLSNVSFFKTIRLTMQELSLIRFALNESIKSWKLIECLPSAINSEGLRDKLSKIEFEQYDIEKKIIQRSFK